MCHFVCGQDNQDLGLEELDSSSKYFTRSSLPSKESAIFSAFGLALGLRIIRHECAFLRLEKPSGAFEI